MNLPFANAIKAAASASPSVPNAPNRVAGLVLIADGDFAAYSCAGNDDTPPAIARKFFIARMERAVTAAGATALEVHLSAGGTTKGDRGLIATVKPYQAQRIGSRKPRNWGFMREYLESLPNSIASSHREADDSIAERAWAQPDLTAIYTKDKDMRMLPGLHLDWDTYVRTVVPYGAYDVINDTGSGPLQFGLKWFWLQMLQGDTADNIPGLPQCTKPSGKTGLCGESMAKVLLSGTKNTEDAYEIVSFQYEALYGAEWADRFCEQAALLWLRTEEDAPVLDFLNSPHLIPPSACAELFNAGARLKERVEKVKHEIESIRSKVHTGGYACEAEW